MEIVEMKKEHEAEYAKVFKDVYFSYSLGFKRFVEELGYETCYQLAIHDGRIVNAMCLSKIGTSLYTPFGFPGGAINSRYIKELYNEARRLAQSRGCNELAIVSSSLYNVQPPAQNIEWRFTHITDLNNLVYPRTIKKVLNRVKKEKFEASYGMLDSSETKRFHKLCVDNIERKNSKTHSIEFINAVIHHLDARFWRVVKDNELLAGVIVVRSGDVLDYFMVGQVRDREKRRFVLEFLIDYIIQFYRRDGVRWMNWQGSCDQGTEFFKERFRADKVWYPVFKHSLVEQNRYGFFDKLLESGTKLGEFWLGKMK